MILDYFRPTINCGSWSDRFNSTWTFLFLLILSIITGIRHYIGPNATCWTPAEFVEAMTTYANTICWLGRKMPFVDIFSYIKDEIPIYRPFSRPQYQRTLYQWLPLILFFQALFFRLPEVILRVCESTFGFRCTQINKMTKGYNTMTSADKKDLSRDMSLYCNQLFSSRSLKFLPFGFVTALVAFVKLLFFINAVTQLSILERYLSPPYVRSYGKYVLDSIINKNATYIAQSPAFPRRMMCDFEIRQIANLKKFTVQCALPVNEFNDQVYFVVWIWLVITCVASGTSGVLFLVKNCVPFFRQSFAAKYLQMANVTTSSKQVDSFIDRDIGQDGVLLLEMIGETSSDILVRDIIVNIWHLHHIPYPQEMVPLDGGQNPMQQSRGAEIQNIYPEVDGNQALSSGTDDTENPLLKNT